MQPHRPPTAREIIFAVLVAALFFSLGAYLSTFPAETVRAISLFVMAGSVIGLAIWFLWGYAAYLVRRIEQPDHGLDVDHGVGEALGLFPVL